MAKARESRSILLPTAVYDSHDEFLNKEAHTWFGLFNAFAALSAMLCIKPSWRQYTSLMIAVHVLGLLWGFGVMARHFGWQHHVVGGLQCTLGTEHRVLDPARAITLDATSQIYMQLLTGVSVVGGRITVFSHSAFCGNSR